MNAFKPTGLLALSLLLAAASARADGPERVERIQQSIDQARFDQADADVRAALRSGELTRQELARVHLSSGVIAAARRDSEGALAGFRRALSLDPEVTLPGTAGPHVAALFEQARSDSAERLAVVASGAEPAPGSAARIGVRLVRDPEKLAKRLRISSGSFRDERLLPPSEHALEVPPPASGCSDVSAELLDSFGNRVWSSPEPIARVCAAEAATPPSSPPAQVAEAERPIGTPIWVGVALTGVGVVATGVFGVIALDRRAEFHDANADPGQTEAERNVLRDDASDAARTATIAAIATGVVGATTLTLYLLRPERSSPSVGVAAAPGGASAVFGARF
jgi:hypothetical protein